MIDLDAVIAAEVKGDPIEVKVGKKKYKLKPEIPWETAVFFRDNDLRTALVSVTVNGDGDAFASAVLADYPTVGEIEARLMAIYAVGESKASPRSSTRSGTRSRPASKRTTTKTSAAT